MTDAKKVLAPECKEQFWTRSDIDKLAYDFWAIHPRELDAWYKGDMPNDFKGGVRAWYFASKIRAALEAAEAERDALKEALKPFDDFAQYLESETEGFMDDDAISCEYRGDIATSEFPDLKFGHFRAARRALEGKAND